MAKPGLLTQHFGFKPNPFSEALVANSNAIAGFGAGLIGGTAREGMRNAVLGAIQGRETDDANRQRMEEEQTRQSSINQTIQLMQQKYPDIAQALETGGVDPQNAYSEMFRREAEARKASQGGGSLGLVNAGDGRIYDPNSREWIMAPDAGKPDLSGQFDLEDKAVKTYRAEPDVKAYQDVRNAYERVRQSAITDSGPGDLGLIFGYMKMLDPGSVVREGEFATAENSGGVAQNVMNLYNKVLTGERLTPEQRTRFVEAADRLFQETSQNITSTNEMYKSRFDAYGLPSERILVTPETYDPLPTGQWLDVGDGVRIRKKG